MIDVLMMKETKEVTGKNLYLLMLIKMSMDVESAMVRVRPALLRPPLRVFLRDFASAKLRENQTNGRYQRISPFS